MDNRNLNDHLTMVAGFLGIVGILFFLIGGTLGFVFESMNAWNAIGASALWFIAAFVVANLSK
jgi:hypothetical protein